MFLDNAFGVSRLKRSITNAAMKSDMVGDVGMACLIVGELEMFAGLLDEPVEVGRDDRFVGIGLEPLCQGVANGDLSFFLGL